MNPAITRAVAQGNDSTLRSTLRPQLLVNTGAALIALCIAGYYLYQGDLRLGIGSLVVAVAIPVINSFNSYSAFLIGKQAFKTHFAVTTIANVSYYVIILIALFFFPAALPLIAINLGVTALTTVSLYFWTVHRFRIPVGTDTETANYAKHLSVMNVIGSVSAQIDNFLVFHLLGPVALATYSIATLIPERASGFLKNITNAVLPRFADRTYESIREGLSLKLLLYTGFVLLGVGVYALLAPYLFNLLYPAYLEATAYSVVFALVLLTSVGNLAGAALLAHRKLKGLYTLNMITPIAQTALQVGGILLGGLWGLVIGRVIGALLFMFFAVYISLSRRLTKT